MPRWGVVFPNDQVEDHMSMNNRLIEGALPITAKLLADDLGLKLHFGGGKFTASVDAAGVKHLYIPELPLDDRIASALALGGVVHEDAHFNVTDFTAMAIADPVLKNMTNILEDIRCEGAEMKRYPGARAVLARMVTAMVEHGKFSPIREEEGLSGVQWYVLYRLRSEVLGQSALRQMAEAAADVIKPQLPGASFQRLTAMMFEVLDCNCTSDCVNLAQQILAMLKEEAENPTPPEQTPEDQESKEKTGQDDQQQSAAQGKNGGADSETPESTDGSENQGAGQDQGQAGHQAGDGTEASHDSGQAGNGARDESAKGEAVMQFLAGANAGGASMDMGDMLTNALDSLSSEGGTLRMPDAIPLQCQLENGEDVLSRLRAETNAVRRKVQGLLEAKARTTILNGRSGVRLDVKRLWRVRTGDARVFEKRIEGHKQDTAIQLLIDRSTSMRGDIGFASDAALAVALAMDGVQGVTTSVAAFPHVGNQKDDDVLLISEFGESFRKVAARFPAVGVAGCTPMAEAILWSGYHLHATNQARKILIVVTDGQPDNSGSTAQVIERLERSGVEIMGLGINIDVEHLFRTSAKIKGVSELAVALFSMLQEKLAKAA